MVNQLLSLQGQPDRFREQAGLLARSGQFGHVMVLTHTMRELPWFPRRVASGRDPRNAPKLYVERCLDAAVNAREHDHLSALYFRALAGRTEQTPDEAFTQLLTWTLNAKPNLFWDGRAFVIRGPATQPG
ncbi:MAG: hypothetical protein AAF797_09750 [Planctomycetota bacterium]